MLYNNTIFEFLFIIYPHSRIFIMLSRIQNQKNLHITGLKLSPDSETCRGVYFTDFDLHIFSTRLKVQAMIFIAGMKSIKQYKGLITSAQWSVYPIVST